MEYDDLTTFRNDICHRNVRPKIPEDCQPSFAQLITQCWDKEPGNRPNFDQISSDLEYILVDYSIMDYLGRKLWVENFLGQDKVPLTDFVSALHGELSAATNLPPLEKITPDMIRSATYDQLNELCVRSLECSRIAGAELLRRFPQGRPFNNEAKIGRASCRERV